MDIDHLITLSRSTLERRKEKYRRFLHAKLNPQGRLIGIKGPRGAGKTTLVMQLLQESGLAAAEALYVTADHPRVNAIRLYDIAEAFSRLGGDCW
ncbi:MAG: AAA family ATPase [Desulfobulbaceae bacterium]|nr:AAA family ATPase [Desulfobulbaceae bacterium]